MSELNLYQRINEVRKGIAYVQKDKSVSTGASGSYKAVSHDQVTALVREHMVKHGIVSYPSLVDSLMNLPMVDVDGKQAKQMRYEATYDFTFCNVDNPSESLVIRIQAHAMDNADKAPGKALSYAKKYALLKLFEIETGEDEESRYETNVGLSADRIELLIAKVNAAPEGEAKKNAYKEAIRECSALNDVEAANQIKTAVAPKNE